MADQGHFTGWSFLAQGPEVCQIRQRRTVRVIVRRGRRSLAVRCWYRLLNVPYSHGVLSHETSLSLTKAWESAFSDIEFKNMALRRNPTGWLIDGFFRYTLQFEKQRVDEDSGMAGLPGVSERDQ